MADRTVKVNLVADVSDYTAGLARAAAQTRGLSDSVDAEFRKTENNAKVSGERTGGTLARGINQGLIRNSPLIVAGVAGALSAGAPAVTAAAGTLFAGIGAVAAAQTVEVRSAWAKLGRDIRDASVDDAAVLVPVFTTMADQIGSAFQKMRPLLRDAFEAAAPQIERVADSLIDAANNAMPALVRSVQAGAPVMEGLASLIESVGQGLADFLDAISAHSGAAGTALAAIGDIVGDLLPILGELLGHGAELAAVVLPPLASALGVVADVLKDLGPILPGLVTAFTAMKVVQGLVGPLDMVAGKFSSLAASLKDLFGSGGTATRALTGMESLKGALGPLSIGVAIGVAQWAAWREQIDEWGQALEAGGRKADVAADQIRNVENWAAVMGTGIQGTIGHLTGYGMALDGAAHASEDAAKAASDYEKSLDPLALAHLRASQAQADYNTAVADFGPHSLQANEASARYAQAQADVERQEGETELAIHGVTSAMIAQADQAMASIDSGFAYRNNVNQLEDAQTTLADAMAHLGDENEATRTTQEDVQRAQLALEEQSYRTALSYGQQQADLSGLSKDSLEYKRIVQEQMLVELYRLRDAAGPEMRAAIDKQIGALQASGVQMDVTSGRAENLRDRVREIPQYTRINVDADLGPAEAKLSSFIARRWTAIISSNVEGSGTTGGGGTAKRLAFGGYVSGPGGPTSDSIPARLSDGEFVVNAASTARNRALLETINARRYAGGGPVMRDKATITYDADMSGADAGMLAARKAAGQMFMASPVPGGGPGGAARWASLVLQALSMMGQPASLLGTVLRRMNQESGGNPNAINLWDSNAKRGTPSIGLMQTIGPTFRAYHDPRTSWNIYDPLANVLASMRYALARYGSLSAAYNKAGGYETGTSYVPETGPAVLHKGEAVLTTEQAEAYRAGLRSREVAGVVSGGGSGGSTVGPVTVNARVFVGSREITDIARVEAEAVVDDFAQVAINRRVYNG